MHERLAPARMITEVHDLQEGLNWKRNARAEEALCQTQIDEIVREIISIPKT